MSKKSLRVYIQYIFSYTVTWMPNGKRDSIKMHYPVFCILVVVSIIQLCKFMVQDKKRVVMIILAIVSSIMITLWKAQYISI